jgi:hypothetical protein
MHPLAGSPVGNKRATDAVPLIDDLSQGLWYGEIDVGTPAVTYTGSQWLILLIGPADDLSR